MRQKKEIILFILMFYTFGFGQKLSGKIEQSTDITAIAKYIKTNPKDPKIPALKRRLVSLMTHGKGSVHPSPTASSDSMYSTNKTNSTSGTSTLSTTSNDSKVAQLLTHLFDNSTNKKEAYINFINQSNCELNVELSGVKVFSVKVPANNSNFLLVPKGNYTISTLVCQKYYNVRYQLYKDVEITFNP